MPKSHPTQPSLVGQTIDNGRYKLVSELGQGSFATVYKGLDNSNRSTSPKYYAIKALYKPGLTASQQQAQKNEMKFLKVLSEHPSICRLVKVVESDVNWFLVMEICETDLFDLIVPPNSTKASRTGLPEPTVLNIFNQLTSALSFAHSKGIYHRDLKPENVLVIREPLQIKLADFGLATQAKHSREFGCGSVRYMSPECLDSKLSNQEGYNAELNDVWSLGIILINLLTGKNPWIEPRITDPNYSLYLNEKQSIETLKNQFKLSPELAMILSRVFSSDVNRRISLMEFHASVTSLRYLRVAPVVPLPSPAISIPPLSNSPPRISMIWNDAEMPSFSPHNSSPLNNKPVIGNDGKMTSLTTILFENENNIGYQ